MYVNEQEVDVEEGGATLEEKVGRYNGDDVDSGVEENDDDDGIEKADVQNVDADG